MPYPPKDGGSIATLSLALALQKGGNTVSILSMNTSKHFIDLNTIPKEITNKIKFYPVNVNIDIKKYDALKNFFFSKAPYNAERFISKKYKEELIRLLKENTYDIIQLEGLYLAPYINIIKKYSTAKIALRSHNIEHEIWERIASNEVNSLKKFYKKNLANRIKEFKLKYINKYDFLIPITYRDGEKYNSLGNVQPIHVVQTGVESERYHLNGLIPEFPGFFHIGALDWMPNQEGLKWFIDNVWHKFRERHPEIKFYLAGRNAPEQFEKYLEENNITYLGEIENANDFINSKSVMVVPLLSGSGMRIKIIEGMALGKTVITTSIGTEGINTVNNENILIADTPNDFLECMERIYNDKSLHDKISHNAIEFVNKYFNNDTIASGLIDFYKKYL
jgi:glycosyltransferase involved in cell wall biosynthesis